MNGGKDDVGRSGRYILVWLMLHVNLHRNWDKREEESIVLLERDFKTCEKDAK